MAGIINLPNEFLYKLFMYLPTNEILKLWKSNISRVRDIMNCNYFWKAKCKSEKFKEEPDPLRYKIFEKYLTNCLLHWEKIYMFGVCNKNLNFNFENSVYKDVVGNSINNIRDIKYFDDEITIATNFNGNEILVINSSTGVIEKIFQTEKEIRQVRKSENYLVAMLKNDLMKVWDLKTDSLLLFRDFGAYICINCIHEHRIGFRHDLEFGVEGTSRVVILNIITNSFDAIIESGICIGFTDDNIAVGMEDNHVKLFNSNFNTLWDFVCCENESILKLEIKEDNLIVFHWSEICIWNIISNVKTRSTGRIPDYNFFINHRMNENTILISKTSTVRNYIDNRRFDVTGNTSLKGFNFVTGDNSFEINVNKITYCERSNNHFMFGVTKNYIYIWCVKTGKLVNRINILNSLTLAQVKKILLFVTETKLAFLINKILYILDYDVNIKTF